MGYVPLRVMSDYSMGIGASKTAAICDRVAAMRAMPGGEAFRQTPNGTGMLAACGISDLVSMSAALEFSKNALPKGLRPLMGCRFVLTAPDVRGDIIVYAMSKSGFEDMSRMLYAAYAPQVAPRTGKRFIPDIPSIPLEQALGYLGGDVLILTGAGREGFASASLRGDGGRSLEKLCLAAPERIYIEICRTAGVSDSEETALLRFSEGQNTLRRTLPIVGTTDCRYASERDALAYEMLAFSRQERDRIVAIDLVAWERDPRPYKDRPLLPRSGEVVTPYHIPDHAAFSEFFSDLPDAISNTRAIAFRCSYFVKTVPQEPPSFVTCDGLSENESLARQARAGLEDIIRDYGLEAEREEYEDRLEMELRVIGDKNFSGYFLMVSDFVSWARDNGVIVGEGRGSGAGSLVAWTMRITGVNPIPYGLLFERFLNPERSSMPDFDIDFASNGRDKVIEYVRQRYGDEYVCGIAAFSALRAKTSVALAMEATQMIGASATQTRAFTIDDKRTIERFLTAPGMSPTATLKDLEGIPGYVAAMAASSSLTALHRVARLVEGLYSHQTRHAAGVVISSRPLASVFPVMRDRKAVDLPVSAYDMKGVEMVGAVKFDFLGLSNLEMIGNALRMMADDGLHALPDAYTLSDPLVYETVRGGLLEGIFQLSSHGMTKAIAQVKPDRFTDVAVISALYRPGPMKYISAFSQRKSGRETVRYPLSESRAPEYCPVGPLSEAIDLVSDSLPDDVLARLREIPDKSRLRFADGTALANALMDKGIPVEKSAPGIGDTMVDLLRETNGFFVYQEQIMIASRVVAGFSYGEADLFRRAIGKKDRAGLDALKPRFYQGCLSRGVTMEEIDGLYSDFEDFANYGFNKSHAVAYSIITYKTAWLKTYFPDYFYAALLTEKRGKKKNIAAIMDEMMIYGVGYAMPCVNRSHVESRPMGGVEGIPGDEARDEGYVILGGLADIAGFGEAAALTVVMERERPRDSGSIPGGPFRSVLDLWRRVRSDASGLTMTEAVGDDDEDGWRPVKASTVPLPALNDRHFRLLIEAGALDNLPLTDGASVSYPANRQQIAVFLRWLGKSGQGNRRQGDFLSEDQGGYLVPETIPRNLITRGAAGDMPFLDVPEYRNRILREREATGFCATRHFMLTCAPAAINAGFRFASGLDHAAKTMKLMSDMSARMILRVIKQEQFAGNDRSRRQRYFLTSDGFSFVMATGTTGAATREIDSAIVSGRPIAVFGTYRREWNAIAKRNEAVFSAERVIDAGRYLEEVCPSPSLMLHLEPDVDPRKVAVKVADWLEQNCTRDEDFGGEVIITSQSAEVGGGMCDGAGDRSWRIGDGLPETTWPVTDYTTYSTNRSSARRYRITDETIAALEALPGVERVVQPAFANMRGSLGHAAYMDTQTVGGMAATEAALENETGFYFPNI